MKVMFNDVIMFYLYIFQLIILIFKGVEVLILDEVDQLLETGFQRSIETIMNKVSTFHICNYIDFS
jgi:superfamily II DNA/RNA helicase